MAGDVFSIREDMTTSENGLNFIMLEEGLKLKPYQDSRGIWTIGIGSTYWENGEPVKKTDAPISQERALKLFRSTLKRYEKQVNDTVTRTLNQNQFDALVSLCYNIGTNGFKTSTVAKRVNANPCDPTIREAFEMWRNAGGKPILLNRRKREASLYFK